jgi:hypothetical protein
VRVDRRFSLEPSARTETAGNSILSRLIELEGDAQPWHAFRNRGA